MRYSHKATNKIPTSNNANKKYCTSLLIANGKIVLQTGVNIKTAKTTLNAICT